LTVGTHPKASIGMTFVGAGVARCLLMVVVITKGLAITRAHDLK